MEIQMVEMTPALAREILLKNTNNRSVAESRVAAFAGQMKLGMWKQNGETVIIGETGRLLDGQHRLAAVVVANVTVPMMIVRGVADDAFTTINTGRSRKASDVLAIAGHVNVNQVAAVAGQLYRMFWSALDDRSRREVVPAPVIMEVVERWPEIHKWTRTLGAYTRGGRAPVSVMAPMLLYLADVAGRPDLSTKLSEGMRTGAGLALGDPVLTFRNKVQELRTGGFMRTDWAWAHAVRVMDAMEAGTSLSKLGNASPGIVQYPVKLKEHLAKMPERRTLIDLAPADTLGKMRNQRDILKMIGVSDVKAFEAIDDREAREQALRSDRAAVRNEERRLQREKLRTRAEASQAAAHAAKPPKPETARSLQIKAEQARGSGGLGRAALK